MSVLKNGLHVYKWASEKPIVGSPDSQHAHPYHEIYFLVGGQRRYFVGHTIYDVFPGDLVMIPQAELHGSTSPGGKGFERYLIWVTEAYLQPFIDAVGRTAFDELMHSGCLQLPQSEAAQIEKAFVQLEREHMGQQRYCEAFASLLVQKILLTALRSGKKKAPYTGESADRIQEVARYISQNYAAELTLHDAAQMACMEDTYFSKSFKRLTGFGFHEYLTQTRLRAAAKLLCDTHLSIGEIAERCGFSGGNYFRDVFYRWNGLSPSAYRRQQRSI